MNTKIKVQELVYWHVRRPAHKLWRAFIWKLPRSLAYWAFIRVATAGYDGNPGQRTVEDAMKGWDSK